jgi:hypothetical protein
MPPLTSLVGWWICVTKGKISSEPSEKSPDFYGKIRIDDLEIDQSNGERGQE